MRRITLPLLLAASLWSAIPAFALKTGGSPMVIPVIGRFPGAGGTQWRTDIFLSNPFTPTQIATLKFYPGSGVVKEATVTMAPFSTATLNDVVLNTFGLENAGGVLEIYVGESSSIEARATIYNTGNPAGRFGQGVPGIARGYLNRQAFLFGLSGIDGSRVNVGVANPNDTATQITMRITDAANVDLYSRTDTVGPHAYIQFNDIFSTFGIGARAGLQINFTTNGALIYGYASEVRNDTGDAIFTFGLSPNS